jgi:hypothetical protein
LKIPQGASNVKTCFTIKSFRLEKKPRDDFVHQGRFPELGAGSKISVHTVAAPAPQTQARFGRKKKAVQKKDLPMSNMFENAMSLRHRLDTLRAEHRELDEAITRLCTEPNDDELTVRRLKKRKLVVRDRISIIEHAMGPESEA